MAKPKIQSGNLRLMLNDGRVFTAIDCSLSLDRATKQRAVNKDQSAGAHTKSEKSWTASMNALLTYGGDEGPAVLSFWDLFDLYDDDSDTLVEVEFVPIEDEAVDTDVTHYLKGTAIITNMSPNWTVDEDGKLALSIQGSGALVKTIIAGAPDPEA